MTYASEHPVQCAGCSLSFPGSKHGKIRAQREGWFFSRDNIAYCPAHVPEWVAAWRAALKG